MAWILPIFLRLHGSAHHGRAADRRIRHGALPVQFLRRSIMTWSKPEFIDWRFGFEITLYIANR
jgi:coenzyme PQQ precursor peptide PqqA